MASHGVLGAVGIARRDGLEDGLMARMVHLVDARAAPHGAPVLDEPFHIGLVDRRIDGVARDPVEDGMKGRIGLVEPGRVADGFAVRLECIPQFVDVVPAGMGGSPAGQGRFQEDA